MGFVKEETMSLTTAHMEANTEASSGETPFIPRSSIMFV